MVRCILDINSKQSSERLSLLAQSERDKYSESVCSFIETTKWVCSEFKQKATEMLDLQASSLDIELDMDCFERGVQYITFADQQLLEVFKGDKEGLMRTRVPEGCTKDTLRNVAKYFKLQVMKVCENTVSGDMSENQIGEEAIMLEDEILHIFGLNKLILTKAIIDY